MHSRSNEGFAADGRPARPYGHLVADALRRTDMTATAAPPVKDVLTDEMLARFDERAPVYDRENRFFDEDFAELRESGYLKIAVPEEFGGYGLHLDEVVKLQRRLAYVAPATAV